MPGLLTLQLPLTVLDGQQFVVDVQQHTGSTFQTEARDERKTGKINFSRRRVLGAFQINVVVKTGEPLLGKLVRNYAALRYIFQAIPAADSWHPVFDRYLSQLGDQISGLGVDPTQIQPSPDDPGIPGEPHEGKPQHLTGKVREVIFDCFGDFKGFVLATCSDEYHIRSQEKGIEEIVLRACRERCTITVCLDKDKLCEIIVRC
jgi:hypothetical protein